MKSKYVNLFDIFTIVSVMIIFGISCDNISECLHNYSYFLTTESGFELSIIIKSWI